MISGKGKDISEFVSSFSIEIKCTQIYYKCAQNFQLSIEYEKYLILK